MWERMSDYQEYCDNDSLKNFCDSDDLMDWLS